MRKQSNKTHKKQYMFIKKMLKLTEKNIDLEPSSL